MANGVYWQGADNNIYVKDNNGVKNYGTALKTYDTGFDSGQVSMQGLQRINDPNPGNSPFHAPNLLGGGGGNYAPTAPNWDINAIYNQAGGQAAAQVNPYYTQQLQQFQTNQANAKALQDQQRQLSLQNLQNTLDTNLQGNETSRGRTSQDVLQNEQQISQQADYRQADQGQQFDQARLAQAKQLAQGGLTGSGLGNQQALQSETARNVQEQRQGAQDQQQVAAQELSKARTFEDLANSDVLSKQAKGQGEKQVGIDWDKFVQGQATDLQSQQQSLEQARLSQLSTVQKQLAQQQLNSMIHAISNPGQRTAAASAYGGAF
jgi:hypothetical protein